MNTISKDYNSKYIYALDAGHGNNTPGKRSPKWDDGTQLFEWEYVRKIRERIIFFMNLYKLSYFIVNPEDKDIGLSERANRINKFRKIAKTKNKEVLTISLHGNAAGIESASGFEVFTSTGQTSSDPIADIFFKQAERTKLFKMRRDTSDGDNDKEARFTILTKTNGPAILTESGFYTNEKECKEMLSDGFVNKVAMMHVTSMLILEEIQL